MRACVRVCCGVLDADGLLVCGVDQVQGWRSRGTYGESSCCPPDRCDVAFDSTLRSRRRHVFVLYWAVGDAELDVPFFADGEQVRVACGVRAYSPLRVLFVVVLVGYDRRGNAHACDCCWAGSHAWGHCSAVRAILKVMIRFDAVDVGWRRVVGCCTSRGHCVMRGRVHGRTAAFFLWAGGYTPFGPFSGARRLCAACALSRATVCLAQSLLSCRRWWPIWRCAMPC